MNNQYYTNARTKRNIKFTAHESILSCSVIEGKTEFVNPLIPCMRLSAILQREEVIHTFQKCMDWL